jgi:hypothetical protein
VLRTHALSPPNTQPKNIHQLSKMLHRPSKGLCFSGYIWHDLTVYRGWAASIFWLQRTVHHTSSELLLSPVVCFSVYCIVWLVNGSWKCCLIWKVFKCAKDKRKCYIILPIFISLLTVEINNAVIIFILMLFHNRKGLPCHSTNLT